MLHNFKFKPAEHRRAARCQWQRLKLIVTQGTQVKSLVQLTAKFMTELGSNVSQLLHKCITGGSAITHPLDDELPESGLATSGVLNE